MMENYIHFGKINKLDFYLNNVPSVDKTKKKK